MEVGEREVRTGGGGNNLWKGHPGTERRSVQTLKSAQVEVVAMLVVALSPSSRLLLGGCRMARRPGRPGRVLAHSTHRTCVVFVSHLILTSLVGGSAL